VKLNTSYKQCRIKISLGHGGIVFRDLHYLSGFLRFKGPREEALAFGHVALALNSLCLKRFWMKTVFRLRFETREKCRL
jgi:hypothetical protein